MKRAIVALTLVTLASSSHADERARTPAPRAMQRGGRFGVPAAAKSLADREQEPQARSIERLARIATDEAIARLLELDEKLDTSIDLRVRWRLVRALGPHAAKKPVRQALVRALDQATACLDSPCGQDPRAARLLAGTAALALARYGGTEAVLVLFASVRKDGESALVAREALLAHPPTGMLPLPRVLDPRTVDFLGDLGDLRATDALRDAVRTASPETRSAALLALAKLGDEEAAPIARAWARSPDPKGRVAAARALAVLSPAEAAKIAQTLEDPTSLGPVALALAASGVASAAPTLARFLDLPGASTPDRARALTGLARAGAFDALWRFTTKPGDQPLAASLLGAFAPDRELLAHASPDAASGGAIATAVRACARPDARVGDEDARTATCREATDALVARLDDATTRARAAQVLAIRAWDPRARFDTADAGEASELAILVADDPPWTGAPTSSLRAWLDDSPALAPMAARALAARGEELGMALLASTDRDLRAHAAMGLTRSRADGVDGRLLSALGGEVDPAVRREILRTLAVRASPLAHDELARCRELEPDEQSRAVCRSPRSSARASATELVVIVGPPGKLVRWERADGVVVPLALDTDGLALARTRSGLPGRATVSP